jgi:hypothetical protein
MYWDLGPPYYREYYYVYLFIRIQNFSFLKEFFLWLDKDLKKNFQKKVSQFFKSYLPEIWFISYPTLSHSVILLRTKNCNAEAKNDHFFLIKNNPSYN